MKVENMDNTMSGGIIQWNNTISDRMQGIRDTRDKTEQIEREYNAETGNTIQ